ncbi:MAG: glycosyltransferase family 39 protein [Candidatus Handelsmanbacteria bacterium]|nr:glycosyltransferase family 39 protein [Candidatus Handelsmanbacteria bacterium]
MGRDRRYTLLLAGLLLLGAGLRLTGLTRGSADLSAPAQPAGPAAFYRFHPDEEMVIRAALSPDFDLLRPPLTVYGVLPIYALRGALALTGLGSGGAAALDDPDSARRLYYLARALAVLCSCGVLLLVWYLGCRYFDPPTAALALALVALAPGAVQQAHFYIVDGFFVLCSVAAIAAALRALEAGNRRLYLLAGALIGATAAVRLNGLLLGGVLLAGHLARAEGRTWPALRRRLLQPQLWLAGGAALLVLLTLEPFLLLRPELLWRANESGDFGLAVKVTRGAVLQPWTLIDQQTIPYLDHWRLWSLAVGWPLALVFLAAPVDLLWRTRQGPAALMVLWCGLYFLLVGQLQARAVRYLIPMLPFLALFAGALLRAGWQATRPWVRRGSQLAAALLMGHLAFGGVAFARIYTEEDSRLRAGRWISAHIPKGSPIGVETGGFSMQGLVSDRDYQHVILETTRIFYTYPYFSCRAQLEFLEHRLQGMEYLVLTDVNRYVQFTAAPELFPAVAGLYRRLLEGEMGFELVQRFKTYPSLLGISFVDDGAEPSFLGYDHPAVWIFRTKGRAAVTQAFARWEDQLDQDTACPDPLLAQVAAPLRTGEWARAEAAVHSLLEAFPDLALGYWLAAQIDQQQGQADSAAANLARYRPENGRAAHVLHTGTVHYLPAHTALSLACLGLDDLALQVLRNGGKDPSRLSPQAPVEMAQSYLDVARRFFEAGDLVRMEEAVQLSTRIYGIREAYNILATRAQQRGQMAQALKWWEQSLLVDPDQAEIHQHLGLAALLERGQRDKARYHLGRAIALDPSRQAGIAAALRAAQEGP